MASSYPLLRALDALRPQRRTKTEAKVLSALRANIDSLEVYYDYKWAGFRQTTATPLPEVGSDIYPVEFPYQVKVSLERGGVFIFRTRWQGWHAKYDTWEPRTNFQAVVSDDKVCGFHAMLETLECQFLIIYAYFGYMEQCLVTGSAAQGNMPISFSRKIGKPEDTAWILWLREVTGRYDSSLLPRMDTLLATMRAGPLGFAVKCDLQSLFFPAKLLPHVIAPGGHQELLTTVEKWRQSGRHMIGAPGWKTYTLIEAEPAWPEVRLPRRLNRHLTRDADALWNWRTRPGRGVLRPFDKLLKVHPMAPRVNFSRIKGLSVRVLGSYVGPLLINSPKVLQKLWAPPWAFTADLQDLALFGRTLYPPFSTSACHVPHEALTTTRRDANGDVWLVSFRSHFGRNSPKRAFLTDAIVRAWYPHLLVDYTIKQTARMIVEQTQLKTYLLVPRIMTEGENSPLTRTLKWKSEAGLTFVMESWSSRIAYRRTCPYVLDYKELLEAKWDLIYLAGPAKAFLDALEYLFDRTQELTLNARVSETGTDVRIAVGVAIPLAERLLFYAGSAGIVAHLVSCGFHPVPGRRLPSFCFPNFPQGQNMEWPTQDKENEILFDTSGRPYKTGFGWPMFINELPKHVGHILVQLYGEIAARLGRHRYPLLVEKDAIEQRIEDKLAIRRLTITRREEHGFQPHTLLMHWPVNDNEILEAAALEVHWFRLGVKLEDFSHNQEPLKVEVPLGPVMTEGYNTMLKAFLIAFGGPAPVMTSCFPPPAGSVSSLGNWKFPEIMPKPPWHLDVKVSGHTPDDGEAVLDDSDSGSDKESGNDDHGATGMSRQKEFRMGVEEERALFKKYSGYAATRSRGSKTTVPVVIDWLSDLRK